MVVIVSMAVHQSNGPRGRGLVGERSMAEDLTLCGGRRPHAGQREHVCAPAGSSLPSAAPTPDHQQESAYVLRSPPCPPSRTTRPGPCTKHVLHFRLSFFPLKAKRAQRRSPKHFGHERDDDRTPTPNNLSCLPVRRPNSSRRRLLLI
nr:unnamed protein product [Digitaria exilis]